MKETFPLGRAILLPETKHTRILETEECHGFASTLYLLHRVGFDSLFFVGEAEQLTCALLGRWEELQVLASEPPERHLLFAGDAEDAANGLYSTLSDPVCTATAPGDPAGHTSVPRPLAWTWH